MPRFWKLLVLAALCLAFLLAVRPTTSRVSSPGAATAAVGIAVPEATVKTAPSPPPPALSKESLSSQARSQQPLTEPSEWQPPKLRTLLDAASAARTHAPLSARLPRATRLALDADSGSYATLRPRQLGEAYQADARLQGDMFTVLRRGYSLSLQQQQNVALVSLSLDQYRGAFWLQAESAGEYLVVLHLSNPETTSYWFHNKLHRFEMELPNPPTITPLVEKRTTIESGASFAVPCLLQLAAGERATLLWYMEGGHVVLFHALTVDKVG